ncbi:hypothetical protein GH714_022767 [Hevea brasiliensis]|uniref:Protein ECERIFERUM 26-like n=1 Tax=Hevea brasiliensis TaxID=3981 RepID=A0A6A6KKT2_HEVBR|nr:hypothetical protein GH714_022767 [Hevea brasiliensis]
MKSEESENSWENIISADARKDERMVRFVANTTGTLADSKEKNKRGDDRKLDEQGIRDESRFSGKAIASILPGTVQTKIDKTPIRLEKDFEKRIEGKETNKQKKVDGKECKINGVIEAQALSIASATQPLSIPTAKSLLTTAQADQIAKVFRKQPHPDTKYLTEVLTVPKIEEWCDFDDQEWLFQGRDSQSKKPKMGSFGVDEAPHVWSEALQIESADVCALPYGNGSGRGLRAKRVGFGMKLHYLKGVYFFSSDATQGLTNMRIKETTFYWLNEFYVTCGRFRRSDDTGRPFMKCNDCGVRMIEAECDKTVDEWLKLKDCSVNKQLVYHQPIGPELSFSPLVYLQATRFKCGGISLGLSWAHILGDPFSAADCINMWSPFWLVSHLLSTIWGQSLTKEAPLFESLCALMWQCIAKVREEHEPRIVTICKKNPNYSKSGILSNSQIVSSVEAEFSIKHSDLKKLAILLADQAIDDRTLIEELVEKDNGASDYIIYGANLTFVDFEKANLYGLELSEYKPKFVDYTIEGVGDEGAVVVLPWSEDSADYSSKGRVVTVILPENEITELKYELKENGLLLKGDLE